MDRSNFKKKITELKKEVLNLQQIEQASVDDRQRLETILATLDTGLAVINPDLTVDWINAKIAKIFPWEELVGKVCYKVAEQRKEPCEGCGALKVFADGQMHETFRQSPIDGRWFHVISIPIMGDSNTVVQVLESTTDITKLKQVEKNLEQTIKKLNVLKERLEEENIYLKEEIQEVQGFENIVGKSNPLLYVLSKVKQVAKTDTTVLIQGETGVGKELIARAIHQASLCSGRPFVKVNCPSISTHLIESELFGHEPGAFTGANSLKKGRFEIAQGGTIFLDEISEISLEVQAKLLGVLQEKKFERVGSSQTLSVDVRIIVATNRNLTEEMAASRFRSDLYYRLNVFPITVPPLRNRRDDIPLLVKHFVALFAKRNGKIIDNIPKSLMERLVDNNWPGNVRELCNVIERACITSPGPVLRLPETLGVELPVSHGAVDSPGNFLSLEEVEHHHIQAALKITSWRISGDAGAAKILKINPSTLRNRIKKLGLKKT